MVLARESSLNINGVSLSAPPLSILAFRSLFDRIGGSSFPTFKLTRFILGVGGFDDVAEDGDVDLEAGNDRLVSSFTLELLFFFFLGEVGVLTLFIAGRGGSLSLLLSAIC